MTDQIILDNPYATVVYVAKGGYIHHTFHQHVSGEIMREVLNKGLDALKQYGACKWLSDDRKNAELSAEDTDFGANDWAPRVIAAGWKYWALVIPESNEARASMQEVIHAYHEQGVWVRIFTNVEDAQKWLETQ